MTGNYRESSLLTYSVHLRCTSPEKAAEVAELIEYVLTYGWDWEGAVEVLAVHGPAQSIDQAG
jgi:hypothetical protein